MDDHAAAAAFQRGFVGADEVFRLFLEFHIGVADQPEQAAAVHREAGEHPVEEHQHQFFQQNEPHHRPAVAPLLLLRRQPNEPLHLGWQRQHGAHAQSVFGAHEEEGHDEAHVWNERERMRRIDRQRGQHGEHPLHEPGIQPGTIVVRQRVGLAQHDPGLAHLREQVGPDALLVGDQGAAADRDLGQLLRGRAAVGGRMRDAGLGLADQAGDPHRIEFIEVGGADRQESHALQQGMAGIFRLLQNAVIEVEPGQFAVDEAFRSEYWRLGARRGRLDLEDGGPVIGVRCHAMSPAVRGRVA